MSEMGQAEVIEYLEKHKDRYHTTKEIATALNQSISTVWSSLNRLYSHREICKIEHYKGSERRWKSLET